jgi:hypothetical protein
LPGKKNKRSKTRLQKPLNGINLRVKFDWRISENYSSSNWSADDKNGDSGATCQIFQDPIVSPILGLGIHIIKEKVEQPVNSSDPLCKSYFGLADRHSKRETREKGRQIYPR